MLLKIGPYKSDWELGDFFPFAGQVNHLARNACLEGRDASFSQIMDATFLAHYASVIFSYLRLEL